MLKALVLSLALCASMSCRAFDRNFVFPTGDQIAAAANNVAKLSHTDRDVRAFLAFLIFNWDLANPSEATMSYRATFVGCMAVNLGIENVQKMRFAMALDATVKATAFETYNKYMNDQKHASGESAAISVMSRIQDDAIQCNKLINDTTSI